MDDKEILEIVGLFAEKIRQKDSQEKMLLMNPFEIDYQSRLLLELHYLECANSEMSSELLILSKFIRNKLWQNPENTYRLYSLLHQINSSFTIFADIVGSDIVYNIEGILEYISLLAKYKDFYNPNVDIIAFEVITDDIVKEDQGKIIKAQWDDVLGAADGMATFIKVFDDVFTNVIKKYEDKFILRLPEDMVLTRCVKEKICDENRFIPCPNKTNNRWNPPGKTYLYLSPKEQDVMNNPKGITGGQYVNLLECRVTSGTEVCFCDFKPVVPGKVLNLSYNDTPLYLFRKLLMDESNRIINGTLSHLLRKPEILAHINNETFIKEQIEQETSSRPLSKDILDESIAKQYLKNICSCIYTKVNDEDEVAKDRAYKSFHILAEYLEGKGITGVLYPSTRSKDMKGNNIVLFEKSDAVPILGTVKQYLYE